MSVLPSHARAVVIGGGIVGCSVAYHLARLGWRETVLVEAHRFSAGSTHHAAGLVGQLRSSASITRLLGDSVALYDSLEAETGLATGWKMNGGLRLACSRERMTELERQATTARSFGLEMHLLSPAEARDLWPPMDVADVVGAAFLPTDGQASPSDLTQALARGARMHGATLVESCRAVEVVIGEGRVGAVVTEHGTVATEVVVNCAGQWARQLAAASGVNVPLVSVQHQYLVTEPIDGVTGDLPTLRDPDRLTYYKEEVGGLVMGGYEPDPIGWAPDGVPEDFHFQLLDSNWEHFESIMALALPRVPALEHVGVKQLLNGPESFTPDGSFVLGEAPELGGYFVGAGFNAFGIASAGGAGKALAEWIVGGEPPCDLWPVDIRRFGPVHRDLERVRARTHELYGKHYAVSWPAAEHASARGARRSPLYPLLREAGACFGEKLGWERANWFAPAGVEPRDEPSFGRASWFEHVGAEHRRVREHVAVFDQSSFAKFEIVGPDAERALQWLCANDVGRPPGSVVYTSLLNRRGGIECDLTVTRLAQDRYYVVTGTGSATRDRDWIERGIERGIGHGTHGGLRAKLVEVTEALAVLSLMGPSARAVLERATGDPVDDAALPFASARDIRIGNAKVRALRLSYVGELGFELHVARDAASSVYRSLMRAGADLGIGNAGYRAIESLRLECGYRAWGSDLTPDHTPLEAGLGWAVKLDGAHDFLGRGALEAQRSAPLTRRLAGFTVDDDTVTLLGRETVYRDGERVGWLTSAGYGHSVRLGIGYGYVHDAAGVDRRYLESGTYELEVATRRIPAQLTLRPPSARRARANSSDCKS